MSMKSTCDNPLCSCDPCTCRGRICTCGVARLGDLERRVIEVLWQEPGREFTGRDVANELPDYAYTTVATVLDRLSHKKLVRWRMNGRTIRFIATGTGATHTATLMRDALGSTRIETPLWSASPRGSQLRRRKFSAGLWTVLEPSDDGPGVHAGVKCLAIRRRSAQITTSDQELSFDRSVA